MQRNCTGQEVLEDLSSKEGRELAIKAVQERYPDGIDILICNAGVGPTAPPKMIFALNFFACVDLAEGLRPLLKKKRGNCVITSSNRIFYCMPLHRQPTLAFPDPLVFFSGSLAVSTASRYTSVSFGTAIHSGLRCFFSCLLYYSSSAIPSYRFLLASWLSLYFCICSGK